MKRRTVIGLGAVVSVGALLNGCSALGAFNALVPKDKGVVQAISDATFGESPRQRLDIYRPTTPDRNLPIIIFFHGGSWNSGSKDGYAWLGRALAAPGFVVVVPNYRLTDDAPYPAFLQDNVAAVRFAIRNAESVGGDPRRIVLAGHSAGAYNAAVLAYDERWLGADRAHVKGFIGLAGPYDFLPFDTPVTQRVFGWAPDLPGTQPVNHVDRRDPPAFIGVAGKDGTVHPKNGNAMTRKLRVAGVPVERVDYPDVGHVGILTAIAKPLRNRASVLEDISRFAHQVTSPAIP